MSQAGDTDAQVTVTKEENEERIDNEEMSMPSGIQTQIDNFQLNI